MAKRILVVLVIILSGCTSRTHIPMPEIVGTPLDTPALESSIRALGRRKNVVRSLRVLSHTNIRVGDEKGHLRHVIVFKDPERLRVEAVPVGASFAMQLLTVDGEKITFVDSSRKSARIINGGGEELLEEIVGTPLHPDELVSIITGTLADVHSERKIDHRMIGFSDPFQGITALVEGENRRIYFVDTLTSDLRRVQYRDFGGRDLMLDVRYGEFKEFDGVRLPSVVMFWVPEHDLVVELAMERPAVNRPVPDSLFKVLVPRGYRISNN